jgi:predicted nucleic acid-binding protein
VGYGTVKIADAFAGVTSLCIDTAIYVYFVENRAIYADKIGAIFQHVETEQIEIRSSVIALTECLTKPLEIADQALVSTYRQLLTATDLRLIPVTEEIAERAARLRASYRLRTPDAIHLATALESGSDVFLTNDHALRRVTELRVLILDDMDTALSRP